MQKFKAFYIGILAILVAGILLGVLFLKQEVQLISATKLQSLIQNDMPKIATIKGEYLYLRIRKLHHKGLFKNLTIPTKNFSLKTSIFDIDYIFTLPNILNIMVIKCKYIP